MLFDLPVLIAGAKRVEHGPRLFDLGLHRSGPKHRGRALGAHVGDRSIQPRQAASVARDQGADKVGGPRDLLDYERFPNRLRRSATRHGEAVVLEAQPSRCGQKRPGCGADQPAEQGAIVIEQRAQRRVSGQCGGGHQQGRPVGDERREQFSASPQLEHIAPVFRGERRGNGDGQ